MPQSRKNKQRKENLENYKNKVKMENQEKQNGLTLPPFRQVPIWAGDAKIEVSGYEWEAIQNGLVQIQMAIQAAQSVMSKNIFNGNIQMDFEKLNPQTLQYEQMTEEEKEPHKKEFKEMIENMKAAANAAVEKQKASPIIITEDTVPEQPQESSIITV